MSLMAQVHYYKFFILWSLGSYPSTLICQIYGSIGHQAVQCSNRFNHAFVADDLPKSFVTMLVGENNDATW